MWLEYSEHAPYEGKVLSFVVVTLIDSLAGLFIEPHSLSSQWSDCAVVVCGFVVHNILLACRGE